MQQVAPFPLVRITYPWPWPVIYWCPPRHRLAPANDNRRRMTGPPRRPAREDWRHVWRFSWNKWHHDRTGVRYFATFTLPTRDALEELP